MEILSSEVVTSLAWYTFLLIIVGAGLAIVGFYAFADDKLITALVCVIIFVIVVILFIVMPLTAPTGEMSYTVEITDPTQYQTLVQKGYTFERLYETKEIYIITGDVLE